jgi:hypothetical protein
MGCSWFNTETNKRKTSINNRNTHQIRWLKKISSYETKSPVVAWQLYHKYVIVLVFIIKLKYCLLCWYWWNCWNHCIHFFALLLQWVNFWLLLNVKWVIFSLTSSEPFSAISWWEQATFRWNGDDVCFMPD